MLNNRSGTPDAARDDTNPQEIQNKISYSTIPKGDEIITMPGCFDASTPGTLEEFIPSPIHHIQGNQRY
jgi:hypothetical protein